MTAVAPADRPAELADSQRNDVDSQRYDADAIVVGAGPGGSSAAYWLASAGLDVLMLEKTSFPREKVCGDGLTPRGTRALIDMGIDVSEDAGWLHNKGLRVIGGGPAPAPRLARPHQLPALRPGPAAGRPRRAARRTRPSKAGARAARADLGHRAGVRPRRVGSPGWPRRPVRRSSPVFYRAPVVLACDGVSGKLGQHLGLHRNDKRPMGVAVRRYYDSPRTHDDYLESWLEIWDGPPGADGANLLPGYGWIFGMGDGTVNVGLGVLNSSAGLPEDRLPRAAHPLARQHAGGMAPARAQRGRADPRARGCRWASTARRITRAGCCSSATPAAR